MSRALKILQINKYNYLKGGSERHFFGLSEILKKKGHKVIVFSTKSTTPSPSLEKEGEEYYIDEVDLNKFSFKNIIKIFYNYDAVKKLEALIEKEKPDIAHLHNIYHQLSPAIITVLKKHKIPVVMTLHDYKIICPNMMLFSQSKICMSCRGGKYYKCLLKKCARGSYLKSFLAMLEAYIHNTILKTYDQVDLFIAPSQFMKDICVRFGVPEKKIKVIYNFVEARNTQHIAHNTNARSNYLLYFGRLSPEKGIGVLLDAMGKIKDEDLKLKIAGEGEALENFKFQISNLKLNGEKIEFLGFKKGEELEKLVAGARAIIMPSIWMENLPYSLLEAMAAGKIVIVSRIGGMKEIVKDGINGFSFKPGSSDDLASKINNLDKFDLNKIGEAARQSMKTLEEEEYYREIMEVYLSLG